jgi:hypothetical protein
MEQNCNTTEFCCYSQCTQVAWTSGTLLIVDAETEGTLNVVMVWLDIVVVFDKRLALDVRTREDVVDWLAVDVGVVTEEFCIADVDLTFVVALVAVTGNTVVAIGVANTALLAVDPAISGDETAAEEICVWQTEELLVVTEVWCCVWEDWRSVVWQTEELLVVTEVWGGVWEDWRSVVWQTEELLVVTEVWGCVWEDWHSVVWPTEELLVVTEMWGCVLKAVGFTTGASVKRIYKFNTCIFRHNKKYYVLGTLR